jgi:CheY-like chemotaxis protein
MLNELGQEVDVAQDGEECLRKMGDADSYDVIFMDLRMPRLDGISATREIRRRERARNAARGAYICALTANLFARDREACMEAGMNDILAKPLRRDDLAAVLARCHPIS